MAPPRPPAGHPKSSTRKRWLIIVAVGIVTAMVIAGVIGQIIESASRRADDVTVGQPKKVPGEAPCDSHISIDQLSDEFGVPAQEFDGRGRCNWAAADSAKYRVSAMLSFDAWYTTEPSFVLHGNAARRERLDDSCFVEIALQRDKALKIRANAEGGRDSCELADALLAIAFDNLEDA